MAEASELVTLTVAGQRHEGWTSVEVTRAIDTMAGSFTLAVTERWADRPDAFLLEAGAECVLAISGETLINGYIDKLSITISNQDHTIQISGRDRAGDLIDCSAIAKPGSWRDTSIEAIAAELARPFGIAVTARASTGPRLRRFALQQGETVQAVIERLCRFAGLLAVSTPSGDVELIAPASAGAPAEALTLGENILAASAEHDVSGRFSDYLVKGQAAGDDHANGRTVAGPSGTARDPGVKRYRPLLVLAEEQATLANTLVRARWEASTRAGRAQPVTVTLPGWRRPDGKLRDRNTIVTLSAPPLFVDGRMLVEEVKFTLGEGGTITELRVVPPAAWSQLAVPETAEASRVGKAKRKAA